MNTRRDVTFVDNAPYGCHIMPMKLRKSESPSQLVVERIHHAKSYSLTVNRALCVGCELCSLICPKEAIKVINKPKNEEDETRKPIIDVDETKCLYCGICVSICPYGAVQVAADSRNIASVVEKESFPQLVRMVTVDASICPIDCKDCEDACPLDLITVASDPATKKVKVNIKEGNCPGCRVCEIKCSKGAIRVRNIFTGKLRINQEKCPKDCRECLNACPITGALCFSEKNGKIHVNELFCTYCGVCKIVCPEKGALELSRSTICHTPVHSGAWNRALEKLTSTTDMAKELREKGRKRTMEAVKRRLEPGKKNA